MVSELTSSDSDRISTRLNSTNYSLWEFQFRVFIKGKGLFGLLDGTSAKPTVPPSTEAHVLKWIQNDARVRSMIMNSVDPSIILGMRLLPTAAAMWKSLAETYSTTSANRQLELEVELANLHQGELDVASYFNAARLLWTEQDLLTASLLTQPIPAELQAQKTKISLLQFLMKLRPEFESLRATLLNRDSLQLEGILADLIREETRLRTQATLDARPGRADVAVFSVQRPANQTAAARPNSAVSRSPAQAQQSAPAADDELHDAAYAPYRSGPPRRPLSEVECHHCHEKEHTKKLCRKRNFCVYCKKRGHIISDCELLQESMGDVDNLGSSGGRTGRYDNSRGRSRPAYATAPAPSTDGVLVTPAALENMVNKAISSAFASLQVTGNEDGEGAREG
ncbi:unnamed protein product [Linum trigynum]|uniref:Retrotransposon Copia-like N-terminal domain-containing protein n=1 Tax=Linum trigynum TaxID=586398 RepID=A0AAV2E8R5_9ROSI